jgi:hypothetical protein
VEGDGRISKMMQASDLSQPRSWSVALTGACFGRGVLFERELEGD